MLKSLLLALLMGGHDLLAVRVAELERLPVSTSPDVVKSQLRTSQLLMELDRIGRLQQKLGAKLVSESSGDFEEGLSGIIDEPMFAELLGRIFHFALQVFGDPEYSDFIQKLDEQVSPLRGDSSGMAQRFLDETDIVNEVDWSSMSLDQLDWIFDGHKSIHDEDPNEIGREMLEMLYDPAASDRMTGLAWAMARTIGRIAALRHFHSHGLVPSNQYTDTLFANCRTDVSEIAAVVIPIFKGGPGASLPIVLEGVKLRINRNRLADAMERLDEHPNAWDEKFGSPPDEAE